MGWLNKLWWDPWVCFVFSNSDRMLVLLFTFGQYCMRVPRIWRIRVENCNKVAHYEAMVQQGTNDIFLSFSKTRLLCLGKIISLVFSIICICWALNGWYTQLWPGVALVTMTSLWSFQRPPTFFYLFNVKRNNHCLLWIRLYWTQEKCPQTSEWLRFPIATWTKKIIFEKSIENHVL